MSAGYIQYSVQSTIGLFVPNEYILTGLYLIKK